MPGEVQIKKGSEINAASGAQTEGMIRMNAITDMSNQICGTGEPREKERHLKYRGLNAPVMVAKPHTASAVHHHGEEGTLPENSQPALRRSPRTTSSR